LSNEIGPVLEDAAAAAAAASAGAGVALQRKATWGVVVLAIRMVVLQFSVLGGDVYLRRRLDPADFGLFAIVQFALAFFAYFGDAGLGGALIQKKEEPTQRELSSIWLMQILLSSLVIVVIWSGAPYIVRLWPDMKPEGVWVLRALSIDLLLTGLRSAPMLLMERHLQFGRLAVLEVVLNLGFYATAVGCAEAGYGVMSLVYAVLTQGSCGVLFAFGMRRWRPSLVLDREVLRPIMKFGIAYQTKNLINFAAGAIAPVYGGRALGQSGLGFVNWAQNTAYFPLKLVQIMSRVSFPLYSRLQGNRPVFSRSLERSIQVCALGTLFFTGLGWALAPNLIRTIYTDKWLPGLGLFYVYVSGIAIGFLSPLVSPAFDAIGKPQIMVRFSIGWTLAALVLVLYATPRWGAMGFVIGSCIPMVVGNSLLLYVVARVFPEARLWRCFRAAIVGGLAVGGLGKWLISPWAWGPLRFTAGVLLLALLFCLVVIALDRSVLRDVLSLLPKRKGATSPPAA
jgi:O-antigen/teichoic acid export membrane protein